MPTGAMPLVAAFSLLPQTTLNDPTSGAVELSPT
jgi:hypothetical protein